MAHQFVLQDLLARLTEEHRYISADRLADRIRSEVLIKQVTRDLRAVEARLSRMG